jgi:hypothetical protein
MKFDGEDHCVIRRMTMQGSTIFNEDTGVR